LKPFIESSNIAGDPAALRARAKRDGYLFFRDFVDHDAVLNVRRQFVDILERHGWLDDGTNPLDAVSTKPFRVEGDADWWPIFDDFQRLEEFHALAHDEPLIAVLDGLFGEKTLVHPRNIGRIIFPNTPTTPPHQDYIHIHGTPETYTAWMPLGDVPRELGGLAVLEGSHVLGLLPVRPMAGAGGSGIEALPDGREWRTSEFHRGDALLFHSHTVHRGLDNATSDRIRLSVDFRYQGVSQPVTQTSLTPHLDRFDWDFVYAGWKSDRYKHYWREYPLTVVSADGGGYQAKTRDETA